MEKTYLTRKEQATYLRARGVPITAQTLADLASENAGPRYAIINGRALSTAEWLDAWVDAQASQRPRRGKTLNASAAA